MLAQNFKSAADLDLSEIELQSLIKFLGMLERGEMVHGEAPLASMPRGSYEFNMAATLDTRCGTIGCIAGWAHEISGAQAFPEIVRGDYMEWSLRLNSRLTELFGIGRCCGRLYDITPEQAAIALRSYLTTGDARWDLAVA